MEKKEIIDKLSPSVKEVCPAILTTITPPMKAVFKICFSTVFFDGKGYVWFGSCSDLKERAKEIYSKSLEELKEEYKVEKDEKKIVEHLKGIPKWKELGNKELIGEAEKTVEMLSNWWNKLGILEGVKYSDIEIFVDPFIKSKNLNSEQIILFKESLHIEDLDREGKKEKELLEILKKIKNGISEEEIKPYLYVTPKYAGYDRYELYSFEELRDIKLEEIEEKIRNKKRINAEDALKKLKESVEISNEEEENIKITRFMSYLLDERRYFANLLNMCIHILMEEFSKRLKKDKKEFYKLTYWEFMDLIKGKEVKINLPRLFSKYECEEIAKGSESIKLFEEVEEELEKTFGKEKALNGFGASPGKITGKVKIVLDPRESDIKQDEILVTYFTQPEYVPLMKKAAGIITEFGGVSSHAAIVSRELGVPCIVGVKNAVKSLRDGELIEMDGQKGDIERTD